MNAFTKYVIRTYRVTLRAMLLHACQQRLPNYKLTPEDISDNHVRQLLNAIIENKTLRTKQQVKDYAKFVVHQAAGEYRHQYLNMHYHQGRKHFSLPSNKMHLSRSNDSFEITQYQQLPINEHYDKAYARDVFLKN